MTVQRHGAYRSSHASRQLSLLVFALLILAAFAHFANVLPSTAATVVTLPGRFEVEDYSSAGQGVGYYDTTAGNTGGKYRTDDVDIQSTTDSSGAHNIAWTVAGEWLGYDTNVSSNGIYVFNVRAATPYSGKSVHIEVDGVNVTGPIAVPNTGGWQNWTSVASAPVTITGGTHSLRLVIDTNGVNLNYVTVNIATAPTTSTAATAAETHGWGPVVAGDEFSYSGAPDSTKWSPYNSAGHAGNGLRRPAQWNVANGVATVTGTSDGTTGGMSAKFARRMYGKWEVRAKTNDRDPKYHPVLLLWRSSNENQRCDEMDFAEGSSKSTGDVRFFLHYGCEPKQTYALKTIDWTQWHTFAIDWNKDRVIGYIDGVEWFRDADPHHVPDQVMYLAVQLDWFPNGTETKTSTMSIDWARAYNP